MVVVIKAIVIANIMLVLLMKCNVDDGEGGRGNDGAGSGNEDDDDDCYGYDEEYDGDSGCDDGDDDGGFLSSISTASLTVDCTTRVVSLAPSFSLNQRQNHVCP